MALKEKVSSLLQARVSLPGGLAMHSIPGRQVCIDTGLPPFFHMPPPAHAHAPAPSSPQPLPSPHSSHTHKVGAGCNKRTHMYSQGKLVSHTQVFPSHILCLSSVVFSIKCLTCLSHTYLYLSSLTHYHSLQTGHLTAYI